MRLKYKISKVAIGNKEHQKNENWWMNGKQCRPWSDVAYCGVWSGSTLFAKVCLSQYIWIIMYVPNI